MDNDIESMLEAAEEVQNALGEDPTDAPRRNSGLQIWDENLESWIPVRRELWRSWTGHRAVWGIDYHGPVYSIESKTDSIPWSGPRLCHCRTCQEHVSPQSRVN